MVQYTKRPHGKKGEQEKGGRKETQEKGPALSFEQEIDERAKHLNERMDKLQTQMDAQKKLLNDKEEELSDEEKEMFRDQLEVLASRVLRVAEQINTGVIIPLEKHDEAQEELARAKQQGSIRGLGRFDEKRQVFITDDETKIKIDVRVPELGHQGKCGFSVVGEGEGMRAIFQYDGYTLEMVYHTDTQKFEVYYTRKGADVTYKGVYDNPDKLPEVFEHFREKVRGDKELERLRKEMRDEERRAVDSNGEEPDKIQKVRSGGTSRIEDTEARKRKELERQLTIERSTALKDKDAVPDDTPHSSREPLPHKPSPTSNIEDMPVNVDIGGDRRKRSVKRLSVIERGKGARRVAQEVNGNGFYDIGDVGEYNPTTGEAAIRDAHFDLNIASVPRSSIETSADEGVRVVLASFYDNHYFIELRYDPSEKKCSVSTYFETDLKQTHIIDEDDTFHQQLPQAVDAAKVLIRDEVVKLQRSQLELEDRVRRLPREIQTSRRIQEGRGAYARAVRNFHEGKIDETKLSMIRRELEDLLDELSVEGLGRKLEEDALKTLAHERSVLNDSRGSLKKLGQKTPEGEYLSGELAGELEALYELLQQIENGESRRIHEYAVRKEDYLDQLAVLTTEKLKSAPWTGLKNAVRPIDEYIESLDAAEQKKRDVARQKKEALHKELVRQIASERSRALKIEEYLKQGLWDDFDGVLSEEKVEIDELRRGTASAYFDQSDRESLGRDVGRLAALRKKIQEAREIADEEERKIEVEMLVHQYALLKAKMYDAMRILASSESGKMSDYVSPVRGKRVESHDEAWRTVQLYRHQAENFDADERREVIPEIDRLEMALNAVVPSQNVIESTLARVRSTFKRVASQRMAKDSELGDDIGNRVSDDERLHLSRIEGEILKLKKSIRENQESPDLARLFDQLDIALQWIRSGKSEDAIEAGEGMGWKKYNGLRHIRQELQRLLPNAQNRERPHRKRPLGTRHVTVPESFDSGISNNVASFEDRLAALKGEDAVRRADAKVKLSQAREEMRKGPRGGVEILAKNKEWQQRLLTSAFEKLKVHERYKDIFEDIDSIELTDTQDNPVEKNGMVLSVRKDVVAGKMEGEIDALVERIGLELKIWLDQQRKQPMPPAPAKVPTEPPSETPVPPVAEAEVSTEEIELEDADIEVAEIDYRIQSGDYTRKNDKREKGKNEDAYLNDPEQGLFAVFDGMGGHAAGDIASSMARDAMQGWGMELSEKKADGTRKSAEEIRDELKRQLEGLNQNIYETGISTDARGMGTTASIVKLWRGEGGERKAIVANVGDSRVYRFTAAGQLERITEDDNGIKDAQVNAILDDINKPIDQMGFDKGIKPIVEMAFSYRNQIYKHLGQSKQLDPHLYIVDLQPGDRLLITSDGVHDNLTRQQIEELLSQRNFPAGDISKLVVERAYEVGQSESIRAKHDDITAVCIDVLPIAEETPPPPVPPVEPVAEAGVPVEDIVRADTLPDFAARPKKENPFAQLKGIAPAREIDPRSEEQRRRAEEELQRIHDEERREEKEERQLEKDVLEMLKAQNPDVFGNLEEVHIVFGAGFEEPIKLIEQNGQVTAVFVTREFAQSLVSNI